jgi:DNA ligase D-like protein (predicted 3'-phosphoesterase)
MLKRSEFLVVEHKAKRAGLHHDLRIEKPDGKMWASWAVRKGVPTKPGEKVLAVRQPDHSRKDALIKGELKSGYGAGAFKHLEKAPCDITIWDELKHIRVDFKGRKFKGTYHLIKMPRMGKDSWLLFKSR